MKLSVNTDHILKLSVSEDDDEGILHLEAYETGWVVDEFSNGLFAQVEKPLFFPLSSEMKNKILEHTIFLLTCDRSGEDIKWAISEVDVESDLNPDTFSAYLYYHGNINDICDKTLPMEEKLKRRKASANKYLDDYNIFFNHGQMLFTFDGENTDGGYLREEEIVRAIHVELEEIKEYNHCTKIEFLTQEQFLDLFMQCKYVKNVLYVVFDTTYEEKLI